jgi:hypothetical protein
MSAIDIVSISAMGLGAAWIVFDLFPSLIRARRLPANRRFKSEQSVAVFRL